QQSGRTRHREDRSSPSRRDADREREDKEVLVMRREHGFSMLEMLVAMAVMLSVTAAVFGVLNPSQGTFSTQPVVSNLQKWPTVANYTITKDLVMTGAGLYYGNSLNVGALNYFFAPIMPSRQGGVNDDPPGTFRTDALTVIYVPSTTAQSTVRQKMG